MSVQENYKRPEYYVQIALGNIDHLKRLVSGTVFDQLLSETRQLAANAFLARNVHDGAANLEPSHLLQDVDAIDGALKAAGVSDGVGDIRSWQLHIIKRPNDPSSDDPQPNIILKQ